MKIDTSHSSPNKSSRGGWTPDLIVCHIADGTYNGTISWEKNPSSQISSHYVLGKAGQVAQLVSLTEAAWTQGLKSNQYASAKLAVVRDRKVNPNLYCISVECEGYWKDTKGKLEPAALNALAELIQHIRSEVKRIYGTTIPIDRQHIVGHFEINPINKPHCPGENFQWDELMRKLNGSTSPVEPEKPVDKPSENEDRYVGQQVYLNGKLHTSSTGGSMGSVSYNNKLVTITRIVNGAAYPYLINNGLGWANEDNFKGKELTVGDRIKITGTNYATGQKIPEWVKANTYTVQQISGDRVLVKEIVSWVYKKDVQIV